ncbi:MAG: hypothetical protein C0485_17835 [Pirellula sp.]|nr:hypothetical protein [Pirellula sp.]
MIEEEHAARSEAEKMSRRFVVAGDWSRAECRQSMRTNGRAARRLALWIRRANDAFAAAWGPSKTAQSSPVFVEEASRAKRLVAT